MFEIDDVGDYDLDDYQETLVSNNRKSKVFHNKKSKILKLDINVDDIDLQLDILTPLIEKEITCEDNTRRSIKRVSQFIPKYEAYHLDKIEELESPTLNEIRISFLPDPESRKSLAPVDRKNYVVIIVLLIVNLLNYIDRYIIAGVLTQIQNYFQVDNASCGLLQTFFICCFTIFSPLFGYLGDRYNRKYFIIASIIIWSSMTFVGSLIPPDKFWLFVITRGLVGVGQSLYTCVAPTIIGDLFTDELRTQMLAVFFMAVPVGSGLGYILGATIADAFKDWRYVLYFTFPLCIISITLLIAFVKEPERGGAEGTIIFENENTSFLSDLKYLFKHKSFMWVTMGFTFATFVMGALTWWVPTYLEYAFYSLNQKPKHISLIFGVITLFAGIIGVFLSICLARKLRKKTNRADSLLCAAGSLISVPFLFLQALLPRVIGYAILWPIVAIVITSMCLCWTLVADIIIYTIHPMRRSIASALNVFICHFLGDAISPYILGAVSDKLMEGSPDTYYNRFSSLQIAMYGGPFFAALSFGAYLISALFIKDDKNKVEELIKRQKQKYAMKNNSFDNLKKNNGIDPTVVLRADLNKKTNAT